jgi:putative endopeptidase
VHPLRAAVRGLGALALSALVVASIPGLSRAAAPVDAIDRANFDPTCKACDDFDRFATGGWDKANPIPAGFSSWGAFNVLQQQNRAELQKILEADARLTNAPAGSDEQKIGAFYRSCMNEDAIEAAGTRPIDALLDDVRNIGDEPALVNAFGVLQQSGVDTALAFGSGSDDKDSARQIAGIPLSGLPMDRDYYLKTDDATKAVRVAYLGYVTAQFTNLGESAADAAADAGAVIALETTIAAATPSRADRRDPASNYHPTALSALPALAPHVPWKAYFATYHPPAFDIVDITRPDTLKVIDEQLTATPLATWKAYLRYHVADAYASSLPRRFADASFAFYSGTLRGTKTQRPRSERCTIAADATLRDVLGRAYVAVAFPREYKQRALTMVNSLQSALHDDIATLAWMSPPTRARAETKLAAYTKKIAYPDTWEDYSALAITDGPYGDNVAAAKRFQSARTIARIDTATNRARWGMTPPTVNAYYNPSNNEIVFPAGILEPPFFFPNADDAVNYGAIGAVIGHEMTHGFDDQGRQYDEKGNREDWWTAADTTAFKARAQCIVDEYDGFEVQPGVHEQGKLVQGEATADLGGLTIAFKAFEKTKQAHEHKMIDGYTPEQRFFLAYAQVWRGELTPEYQRQLAQTDPHPDDHYRVIGTLSNMPEFRAAFHCKAGDPMVRANSCQIW